MRDFFKLALADRPAVPFRVPPGIKLIRIDGEVRYACRFGIAERYPRSVQAWARRRPTATRYAGADGAPVAVSPEADRAVRTGSGLY